MTQTVHIWQKTKSHYERNPKGDGYPTIVHLCELCAGYINFMLDGSHECIKCKAVNRPMVQVWQDDLSSYRARRQADRYDEARTRLDAMIEDIPHQRAEDVSEVLANWLVENWDLVPEVEF